MADWLKPTITSNYVTFVDEVKERDFDAISLQLNALVNPPIGSVKLVRSPVKFQQWAAGGTWTELVLSVEGGGTGSTSIAGIRTNLGLGSMAYQNANAIAVTGGTIANISSSGAYFNHQGGTMTILTPTVAGHALTINAPGNGYQGLIIAGSAGPISHGMYIAAGANHNDFPLRILNYNSSVEIMRVTGGGSVWIPGTLAIPVGADKWVPW
jgi:hypothetical protein